MNIAALERDYEKKLTEAKSLFQKQSEQAETEDRLRTDDEKKAVDALMTEAKTLKARLAAHSDDKAMADEIARMLGDGNRTSAKVGEQKPEQPKQETRSMGQQFVESEGYEFF